MDKKHNYILIDGQKSILPSNFPYRYEKDQIFKNGKGEPMFKLTDV